MTSLQQVLQAPISPFTKTRALAIHRRSITLLIGTENGVCTTRQDTTGKWVISSEWAIPANTGRVLGYYSLEAYSTFVILLQVEETAVVTFLDLSGKLMNSWPVARVEVDNFSCAADIDQNRRELILCNSKNDMFSIALRCVVQEKVKGVRDAAQDTTLFEALVRIKGHLNPRSTPPPTLLVCFDLQGSYLTLNPKGLIMGFESSTLEIMWALESDHFLYKPSLIYPNRFGSGFFVYSRSEVNKASRLEYWSPPDTSVGCNTGTFTRTTVPLTAPLACLSVESVGKDIGTYAVIVQADREVLLWKMVGKSKIVLDAKITLTNGHEEVFRQQTVDRSMRRLTKIAKYEAQAGRSVTTATLRTMLPGLVTFSAGSGIPDSPMTIAITVGNIFSFISMHVPRQSDLKWLGWTHEELRAGLENAGARRDHEKHSDLSMLGERFNLKQGRASPELVKSIPIDDRADEDVEIVLQSAVGPDEAHTHPTPATVSTSTHNQGGELVTFDPLSLVDSAEYFAGRKSLALEPKEGMMGLVLPSSVLATSTVSSQGKSLAYKCDVRLIQRGGLYAPNDVESAGASVSLDIVMGACAFRSRKFVVLSVLKELFWMKLPTSDSATFVRQKPPVKVGVDIRAVNVSVTCLSVGDVFMKLPAERLNPETAAALGPDAVIVSGGIIGKWVATFAGDSAGNVHFFLTAEDGVVQQGQFLAHKSTNPIVSILMTGDAMRPLWRIAATNTSIQGNDDGMNASGRFVSSNNKMKITKVGGKLNQLRCAAIPGSALVTIARDGEVKVWQPLFTQIARSKADVDQLLNIFEISWKMSGIFAGLGNPYLYISSAALDPTCMSVMLSTSNGFILQWPIPGLVESNSGSLATCRDSVSSVRRHETSITSMRVWIDGPNTTVSDVQQLSAAGSKFAAMIRGPLSGTIAYTAQELQYLAGNSSLITSGTDYSVVLWRFSLSKVFQGPESVSSGSRYLSPTPCRRLFFSAIPREGICFPVLTSESVTVGVKATGSTLTWKVAVLLNGVVVTAAQSPYYTLFDPSGFNGEQTGATLESSVAITDEVELLAEDNSGAAVEEDDFDSGESVTKTGTALQMMPVTVNVLKPNRLAVITPKSIGDKFNSWTLLNTEWLHRNVEAQPITQLETSLVGLEQFAARPSDATRMYETFQNSRPNSVDTKNSHRDASKSPDHHKRVGMLPDNKIDVGVDPDISLMKGIRMPSDVPDKPVAQRLDGLVPMMKHGFRVLVTPEQVSEGVNVVATSTVENDRMVYNSPEKRMDERRISPNHHFDNEVSLFSSLNTPMVSSAALEPLSPGTSIHFADKLMTSKIERAHSLDHIVSPPVAKMVVGQLVSPVLFNQSQKPRRATLDSPLALCAIIGPDDKSVGIDLQSRGGGSLNSNSPNTQKLVSKVPTKEDRSKSVKADIAMSPKASLDIEDNGSIDSEFDPTYIEATMSLMSNSTGRIDDLKSAITVKSKGSGALTTLDLQSSTDIVPFSPQTPSKVPKPVAAGKKPSPIKTFDAHSVHLPFDDEAPVVEIEHVHIRDDASEVSDLEVNLTLPGERNVKPKSLKAAEQRALKIKYVSKPRVAGPIVGGKVVLQPYATPKLGFVPSKNFYERKMEEGKQRVVVEKDKKKNVTAMSDSNLDTGVKSRTTVGVVNEGDQLMLGKSSEFVQNNRYFNWASDPLFLLRGEIPVLQEADSGLDLLAAIPDDHVMFCQVDATISHDEIIKDLSQLESSQLKRMDEEEREAFLQEKMDAHMREVEASKHFFREMLSDTNVQQTSAGGPKKRNAFQKTTLSLMHLKKWGFVNKALENGAMSHDDLEMILKQAVDEERAELTTAEKNRKDRHEKERQNSFVAPLCELDAANYSDTESETSLVFKGGSNFKESFEFENEDAFNPVDVRHTNGMEGVRSRPPTADDILPLSRSASQRERDGDKLEKLVEFTEDNDSSPASPNGASAPIDVAEVLKLVEEGGGSIVKQKDGSEIYVAKNGDKFKKMPQTNYFVKVGTRKHTELTIRSDYKSAGSAGEVLTSEFRPGSMVSRSQREALSRTPKKRKIYQKRIDSFESDSDDEDFAPTKKAFLKKSNSNASDPKSGNSRKKLKEVVSGLLNKTKSSSTDSNDVIGMLTNMVPSLPQEGEITFLGFSKFLKAVNAKIAESVKPPKITASVSNIFHDRVTLKFESNKKCCVWAIATEEGSSYMPKNVDFDNLTGLMNNPEVIAMNAGIIGEDDEDFLEFEMTLKVLKAEKKYKIYFCSDLEKGGQPKKGDKYQSRTPDIVIEDQCIHIRTAREPPEILDIEWCKLTPKQQELEVKAAARSLSVQAAARLFNKAIPTDEEIAMKSKPAQIPAMKKWTNFVEWWTGGDATLGFSAPRVEFQSDEILFAVQDDDMRMACHQQGYISDMDLNNINAYIFDVEGVSMEEGRVVPTEDLPRLSSVDLTIFDDQSFQFFRSWYKGGRVCERQQFWNSPARALMLEIAERDVEDDQNLMLTVTQGDHKNPDVAEDISINDSMTDATGIPGQFKLLLSDIPYNVEQGRKASEAQMLRRAELLQKRIQYVENRKVETARLLELHKHCEKESLRFGDLQTKRNALSKLDIDALMASKKLAELCRQADVEMFRLPGQFMQRVCKADIFLNTPKSYLTPDNPPPLIKGNAEDGGKFPVKFWLNCSDLEKELECRIACMLDSITELAVVNSIYVPSIEDADMDDTLVPIRSNKWKRFVEWYAGPERTTAEPTGFSKARLAFSDWERSAAGSNFFVHLRVRGKAPTVLEESPPLIVGEDEDSASVGSIGGMSIASVKSEMTRDSSTVMTGVPSVQETAMSREAQLAQIKKEQEIVVDQYTDTVNTQSGADLRVDLFTEYVAALNSSRYASVMRCMWPSAPPRQSIQYMFPRMGLLTPIPEPHTLHMKLYASRKIDGYTIKDIMKFFSVEELNDDDTKMQKAEEKGKKFEEYIIWLSKEKDRVAAGRAMMLEEDVTGHKFRILQDNLARKIADPKGNPNFNAYSMAGSLPGAYDGFMEGTAVYVDGDGCLNEDEIFDIKDDMIRRAREGFLALQEKKRIALEDQKKAEELERIRAEKREREKRIQEGVMRRQNIRAKLALIKEERELKTMIAHRDRLLADEEEKKKLAHELALRMAADLKKAERDNELRERHMMAAEEAFQRAEEFLRRNRHGMEREDMLSHTREDLDAYAEEQLSERMKDLKELYTSLEPFHFKKRRAETGWLDTDEREPFYARVEVPVSPTGSRFPPEKKKRQPAATIQEDDGRILYPATMSTKFHSNGVNRFIRFPDVTVKETRFNSPPRFQSPIIENKIATILSKTAPVGEMYIANGLSNRSDQVFSPLQAAENAPSRAHPSSRTEVMFKLDDFLPAIAHHMQSPLTASELEHRGFDNKNGDAEGIQLPSIIVPRNHSKAIKGNTLKTSKSDFGQKSIELSGKDDLKYVISKDITGLQNRKKLLRASLSGLDWKKEFVKAPRARLKHHIHQSSERLVDRVKKERDDVGAYLSEASTHEVLEDKYYAMACEPGIRYVDSVNANNKTIVHDFRMSLFQNLAVIEELAYCEANNIAVSLPIDPRNDSPQNPPIDDESVNSAAAKIKLENEIKNAANLSRGSAKSRQLDTANSDVNNRPLTTKTTLTRATTAATLPEELEFPVDKIDYRQINVPPPFFRKTFGVLGSRKEIGLDPKILAKSESVVSLKK